MIEADTPTLWELRREIGHAATIAILVKAFIHAAKLVNLDKNLTVEQIGEAANDILESHGYLKVEEVKYLLKRALRTQNVYGRLDYNVLMNWVEQYDAERTEEAIKLSQNESAEAENSVASSEGGMDFATYLENLKERAKADEDAAKLLDGIKEMEKSKMRFSTNEQRQQNEKDFKMWRTFKYLMGDKDIPKD